MIDSVTSFLTGLGGSIVEVFDQIVVGTDGQLTNFATWALVFLGVSLGLGVITAILRKVG